MIPDAIHFFNRIPEYQSRYIQIGHKGRTIPEFPSVYKKGKHKGEKYLVFRKISDYFKISRYRFTHTLELSGNQIITGLIFMPEYPRQSYGVYKNYCLLIEFSEDFNQLTIWFFKGLHEAAPLLFQRRQAGQIAEVTKTDKLNLRYRVCSSAL